MVKELEDGLQAHREQQEKLVCLWLQQHEVSLAPSLSPYLPLSLSPSLPLTSHNVVLSGDALGASAAAVHGQHRGSAGFGV